MYYAHLKMWLLLVSNHVRTKNQTHEFCTYIVVLTVAYMQYTHVFELWVACTWNSHRTGIPEIKILTNIPCYNRIWQYIILLW